MSNMGQSSSHNMSNMNILNLIIPHMLNMGSGWKKSSPTDVDDKIIAHVRSLARGGNNVTPH